MEEDFYNVEFIYEETPKIIQCNTQEKMENIIERFTSKIDIKDKKSLFYLYSGNTINEELTLKEIIGKNSSDLKKIEILVYSNYQTPSGTDVFIKSKNIICPECKDDIRLKINDYKIYLYDCKNGHKFNDILLNEFEETQKINLSKIKCNICNIRDRGSTFNNEFYYCISCKYNICPLCKNIHEKQNENHKIKKQKDNNLFCNEHNDSYIKYCKDCRENLCFSCTEKHKNHKVESYEDIIPDMKMMNKEIQNLDKTLHQLENNIKHIITKFNFVIDNLKIYYQIYKELIENYDKEDNNKRNYEVYQNINEFKNNIINELNNINENNNTNIQLGKIIEIYDKMINKNNSNKGNNDMDKIDNIFNNEKIIICEKCYNIPEITFLLNNKIRLDCSKCKTSIIKDISYFDKFIYSKDDTNLFDLPNCSYYEGHKCKAIKYCFDCEKYLCEECIKNHNMSIQEHNLMEQKIESDIYCEKKGHFAKRFDKYCIICKEYLCPNCKCEHENQYYYLNDPNKEKKINKIYERIWNCEDIIEQEEKNVNIFLEKINNKSETLKKMFEDYKERNLKQIALYKLLVNNYEKIKNINNFNIENNIIKNDNFDFNLSSARLSLKYEDEDEECLSSRYNELCNFYLNKNIIITEQQPEFFITKKFCNKKIKKIILMNDNRFLYFFEAGNRFYILFRNEKKEYVIFENTCNTGIKDINLLSDKNLLMFDNTNDLNILECKNNKYIIIQTIKKIDLFINDSFNTKNFFILKNMSDIFVISYLYEVQNKLFYPEKKEPYDNCFIYVKNKDLFSIQNISEYAISEIENSVLKSKHKEKLKNLFKILNIVDNRYELLLKIDSYLLGFLDYKAMKLYKKLKDLIDKNNTLESDENKDHIIYNTNYIIYMFKYLGQIKGEYKEKINYILNLNLLIMKIRDIYFDYIAVNSKIRNGYNFNNNSIIFLVDKYLFIEYDLKKQKFYSLITPNFLPIQDKELKNLDIKYIYSNFIILNNDIRKSFYLLEKNDDTYLIRGEFKYYSNIVGKNENLFFDVINKSYLEFKMITLLNHSPIQKNEFKELFNFKVSFNIPKIISLDNNNKYLLLYEHNQICIIDFYSSNKITNKNILGINKSNTKENNQTKKPKRIKEIIIKKIGLLFPKILKYSGIYSESYGPSNLFIISDYYYCTYSNSPNHFIELKFEKEYNFSHFKLICYEDETKCRPKKYSMILFDGNTKMINKLQFFGKKENIIEVKYIGEKAQFIRIEFKENFGGKYFILKKIEFYAFDEISYY